MLDGLSLIAVINFQGYCKNLKVERYRSINARQNKKVVPSNKQLYIL